MPRETGVVTGINKDKIVLRLNGGEHCMHCAAKSMCAVEDNGRLIELPYEGTILPGEKVEIEYTEKSKILIALIIFLIPLLVILLGYILGGLLFHTTTASVIGSVIGLICGFLVPYIFNKWNEKRNVILPRLIRKV